MLGVEFKFVEGINTSYVERIISFSKYTKNNGNERNVGIFRERGERKN